MSTQAVRAQIGTFNLSDITDVTIGTPVVDQILRYNGSGWAPGAQAVASASSGVDFYLDDTTIIASSDQNTFEVNTLTKIPITTTEVLDETTLTNTTVVKEAYLYNTALGRTQLDAGVWWLSTYASINSLSGVGTAEIITGMYNVIPGAAYTVTTYGSGTSRIADITGGPSMVGSMGNADITLCSYLQTPKGVFQISNVVSSTSFDIIVPSSYSNESAVAFSIYKRAFNLTTGNITTTQLGLYEPNFVEAQVSTALTDKLAAIYFVKSTYAAAKTITFSHNGSARYSHFHTPLVTLHDDLAGIYGTSSTESYGHVNYGAQSFYGEKTFTADSGAISVTVNQNNSTKAYVGNKYQRQGVETWFIGMDATYDDFIIRSAATTNILKVLANGDCVFNRSITLHETGDSIAPASGYASIYVTATPQVLLTLNHGGETHTYSFDVTLVS